MAVRKSLHNHKTKILSERKYKKCKTSRKKSFQKEWLFTKGYYTIKRLLKRTFLNNFNQIILFFIYVITNKKEKKSFAKHKL